MNRALVTLTFIIASVAALGAKADPSAYPSAKVAFFQSLYSGEKGKSLGEAGSGYGLELENSSSQNSFISFYLRVRGGVSSGTQSFYDDTTLVSSPFTFYQGQAELGVYLYPLLREKDGLNVYFGAGGVAGYNYITLSKATTLTSTPHSSQSVETGYNASIGGEYVFKTVGSGWGLNGQLSYRNAKAKVLNQNDFDLSAIVMTVGISF